MSPAIVAFRRAELEAKIEELIALLDLIDGDENLEDGGDAEPWIGGPCMCGNGKIESDLEHDNSDYELSYGWSNPMGLRFHVPEEARHFMSGYDGGDDSASTWTGEGVIEAEDMLAEFLERRRAGE